MLTIFTMSKEDGDGGAEASGREGTREAGMEEEAREAGMEEGARVGEDGAIETGI